MATNDGTTKTLLKQKTDEMCTVYSNLKPQNKFTNYELELRFGTRRNAASITKTEYDRVIQRLLSLGFSTDNFEGTYYLRASPEVLDPKTGEYKQSNIRAELTGIETIQKYCQTDGFGENDVTFLKKTPVYINNEMVRAVEYSDFGFRCALNTEESYSRNSRIISEIVTNWPKSKKHFRYLNRVSFTRDDIPFRIDLSIVRMSDRTKNRTYTVSESGVFDAPERFEIEAEALPRKLITTADIQNVAKIIMCGIQNSSFPISYAEQEVVARQYLRVVGSVAKERLHSEVEEKVGNANRNTIPPEGENVRLRDGQFIGYSSKTLELKNLLPIETAKETNIPNIREGYTVTDKADGIRHLLIIAKNGKCYLMDMNMNISFTGLVTKSDKLPFTILDGELIARNKLGNYIGLFAAFDVYFGEEGKDVRALPLVATEPDGESRLNVLSRIIKILNDTIGPAPAMRVGAKQFYGGTGSIFEACGKVFSRIKDGLFEYHTDGVVLTPAFTGVASDVAGKSGPLRKITWDRSFKYKDELNTVDFLVLFKKDEAGHVIVTPVFENGIDTSSATQLTQYITLLLHCGYDEAKHGYLQPCESILRDDLPDVDEDGNEDKYRPMQFIGFDPYDVNAGVARVVLRNDELGNPKPFTLENEVIEDGVIVECKYNASTKMFEPLRLRRDKTAQLLRGQKQYGNAYNVVSNIWHALHYPITREMITTGTGIPEVVESDDTYYTAEAAESKTHTRGLRDFHNLFVKRSIIVGASRRGGTLCDLAVGKGGDISKWQMAKLSFVFGVDISRDNIENRFNGACARFLRYRREYKNMPYALFVNGNSALNVRTGEAALDEKSAKITKAVFGTGSAASLGAGVERQQGVGAQGFDVVSCQFALHYFFENMKTFMGVVRNIAECTKTGGHFIGTCYDGKTVFERLRHKKMGESVEIYDGIHHVWSLNKEYENSEFVPEVASLGFRISVFQESIGQNIPEWLVNFEYFTRIMEDFGFVIVTKEEANAMHLPAGTGMFSDLFLAMEERSRKLSRDRRATEYGNALDMKFYEKEISFLNRYFVFKKVRSVDAEKIAQQFLAQAVEVEAVSESARAQKVVEETEIAAAKKRKPRKLRQKLVLIEATPSPEVASAEELPKVVTEVQEEAPQIKTTEVTEGHERSDKNERSEFLLSEEKMPEEIPAVTAEEPPKLPEEVPPQILGEENRAPEMTQQPPPVAKPRCPRGTRRNKKTGNCDPVKKGAPLEEED